MGGYAVDSHAAPSPRAFRSKSRGKYFSAERTAKAPDHPAAIQQSADHKAGLGMAMSGVQVLGGRPFTRPAHSRLVATRGPAFCQSQLASRWLPGLAAQAGLGRTQF